MDWQDQLISLYLYVCKCYQSDLWVYCQRMSNYADLRFSDEEVLTLFLFGIMDGHKELKKIHRYGQRHLLSFFPKLPSYTAFIQRINKVSDCFAPMISQLNQCANIGNKKTALLIDAMPIVMAQRSRRYRAKVAPELAHKNGYCATKKMHYYGVKLQVIGRATHGGLPAPEYIGLTSANIGDRKAFDAISDMLHGEDIYADKAYAKQESTTPYCLLTPIKKQKGQEYLDAEDQWISTAIAKVRQPIESLFNWFEQKTGIQVASKVRSYQGLMVHVFGRLAAAMWMLVGPYGKLTEI